MMLLSNDSDYKPCHRPRHLHLYLNDAILDYIAWPGIVDHGQMEGISLDWKPDGSCYY